MRRAIKEALYGELGSKISITGWVKSVRAHKKVSFIEVNDGSCLTNIQVVGGGGTSADPAAPPRTPCPLRQCNRTGSSVNPP